MKMKNIAIAAAAAAVLGAGGLALKKRLAKPAKAEGSLAAAVEGSIEETVEATGSVAPLSRVEVKPPIGGRVEKLLVDEGARVQAGQIIAWMSSTDRAAILDAARAQGPDVLARWQDTYKPTPIVASLPGLIILRNVVEGQTVDPSTVLFAMSDRLVVVAQVDESDIGRIRVGMPARVTLDSYPDRRVEGRVFDVLYEGRNVSNVIQYGVKIGFDRVPDYFRSQMTANVSFIVRRKDKAVLVAASAVRDVGGVKQVWVPGAEPDAEPVAREVKTGIENDQSIEIVAGLSAGDQVVIRQGRYVPQAAPQSSPLTMGGRPGQGSPTGQAPKPKR